MWAVFAFAAAAAGAGLFFFYGGYWLLGIFHKITCKTKMEDMKRLLAASSRCCGLCRFSCPPCLNFRIKKEREPAGFLSVFCHKNAATFYKLALPVKLWYIIEAVHLHSGSREEVKALPELYNFILPVSASVVAYYICKWLDGQNKGQ